MSIAEALELDPPRTPAEAEDETPVRDVVQHRDLLRDADRIVPRQHDDHRAELDALGAARHVRQELQHVRTHGVVREVVLDPQIESKPRGSASAASFSSSHRPSRP